MSDAGAVGKNGPGFLVQSEGHHSYIVHSDNESQPDSGQANINWMEVLGAIPCNMAMAATLNQLPIARELTPRPTRTHLNLTNKKNHEAALGQTRGKVANPPCINCSRSNGPFTECVTIDGHFAGACCNCHYSSQSGKCSFHHRNKLSLDPKANVMSAPQRLSDGGSHTMESPPGYSYFDTPPTKVGTGASNIPTVKSHVPMGSQYGADAQHNVGKEQTSLPPVLINQTSGLDEERAKKRRRVHTNIHDEATAESNTPQTSRQQPLKDHDSKKLKKALKEINNLKRANHILETQNSNLAQENRVLKIRDAHLSKKLLNLRDENIELIGLNYQTMESKLGAIRDAALYNSIIRTAVDARESHLQLALTNLQQQGIATPAVVRNLAFQQLQEYSRGTSDFVGRLVATAMMMHEERINEKEREYMRKAFRLAVPGKSIRAVMEEKVDFVEDGEDSSGNDVSGGGGGADAGPSS